jgi:hypothetical protein
VTVRSDKAPESFVTLTRTDPSLRCDPAVQRKR